MTAPLNLYFAPLACSLATRISLYEVGAPAAGAQFTRVDTRAKRLADGSDFYAVNPMGQVPVLRTEDGELLTENSAVLQYVADRFPGARLVPESALARARLRECLGFIGTELHKAIFLPLLDPKAAETVKAYAREKIALRMGILEKYLAGREHLLEDFSIADAYLITVLNWCAATRVNLAEWPNVQAYHQRLLKRPSVARAFGEELAMYQESLAAAAKSAPKRAPAPPADVEELMHRFNGAFVRHDPAALEELVADDCTIENTQPAPDGSRHVGKAACLAVWQSLAGNTATRFHPEEVFVSGDRAVLRWRYVFGAGASDSVRGVNLMRARDGKIVEAMGYVKGV
jgi:glutathione S-transferase